MKIRTCRRKIAYKTHQQAVTKKDKLSYGYRLVAYKCTICNHYHLGKPYPYANVRNPNIRKILAFRHLLKGVAIT